MYRQILTPTEKDHIISLPPEFYGKRVEIIAVEIGNDSDTKKRKNNFLDDIEPIANFPSIEQIRAEAWPEK